MTPRQRVLKTFRFEPTDRPAYDLMEGTVWPELMEHFQARHGLRTDEEVLEFLGTDFRWGFMRDAAAQAGGRQGEKPRQDATYTFAVAHGPLADATSVAEVQAHAWPDPAARIAPDFAEMRRRWPDHALAFAGGWRPLFWGACDLFGVEEALIKLMTAPAVFEAAVRRQHEHYMEILRRGLAAAEGYADICWLGDDFASQQSMMLSPAHWRRFIKPYLAEQVRLARERGLLVLFHSCGAVRPVLGDLIDIGVNGLLVFQTRAAGMDAESIARDFGGRLVFYGGVDVQQLLSFGTVDEVRAEVQSNVRAFARCGGYVVANSHHCVATIRGELIETMCAAARECGSRDAGDT